MKGADHRVLAEEAWSAPSWREAAKDYHEARGNRPTTNTIDPGRLAQLRALMADNITYEHAYRELMNNRPASQALVDALVYSLRRGVSELIQPETQRRLSALSEDQLELVCDRVQNFKSRIAPAWSADDVDLLISAWRKFHGDR
jgi:hypothetical protein